MKKLITICMAIVLATLLAGQAQAATWHTISFTGTDMFNYTSTVAQLYNQDAPRRERDWVGEDTIVTQVRSDGDLDSDGTNDYAEWAVGNLASYGFSYFNLIGGTIASNYWDQPYHAVPDQGDGRYGVDSWRNQTVNGVAVHAGMGSVGVWDGGIVQANHGYQAPIYDNYAFPVWRAPTGTQVTMANAASLLFSVDVLIENYDTAFEPDGKIRVWFGGFNVPQLDIGPDTPNQEVAGVMLIPEPATICLLGLGALSLIRRKK